MRTKRRTVGPVSRLHDSGGFSLVETMVAVAISLIVGLAIYTVFNYMQRGGQAQKLYNDTQTGCSFAMEQLKGELLRAGYRAPKYKKLVPGDLVAGVDVCVATPADPRCQETTRPISNAAQGSSTITLEYFDDNAREVPIGYNKTTEVTYELDVNNQLVRKFKYFDPVAMKYTSAEKTQVLAANITGLEFRYLAGNDSVWDGVDPLDIRTILARIPPVVHRDGHASTKSEVQPRKPLNGQHLHLHYGVRTHSDRHRVCPAAHRDRVNSDNSNGVHMSYGRFNGRILAHGNSPL